MGQPYVYPDNDLAYSGNFLNMMYKMTELKYEPESAARARLWTSSFILHADHEQNCSTEARCAASASSQVDPYSAIAAGGSRRSTGRCTAAPTRPSCGCSSAIETKENIPELHRRREERRTSA